MDENQRDADASGSKPSVGESVPAESTTTTPIALVGSEPVTSTSQTMQTEDDMNDVKSDPKPMTSSFLKTSTDDDEMNKRDDDPKPAANVHADGADAEMNTRDDGAKPTVNVDANDVVGDDDKARVINY